MTPDERKNRRVGIAVSTSIHAVLILLFLIINAWKAPDPPLPEYGIELNFGLTDDGAGDVQPQRQEIGETVEEPVEEVLEEEVEEVEPQEIVEEVVETPLLQDESPDVIPQEPEPKPKVEKQPVKEEKKEEAKPKPTVNENAVMGSKSNSNPNTSTSQGDRKNTSDQGANDGSVDARALHGTQGGGDNGPLFNIANWKWDKVSIVKDASNESGKIVFRINVDDSGYIIGVNVIETTVSPGVVQYYKNQVEKFTFSYSVASGSPPPQSSGTITLFIRQN